MDIKGEIKWMIGNDYAILKFSEGRDFITIDVVMVPATCRGKGIGTFLMKRVLYIADRERKTVFVTARPIGSFSNEKLKQLVVFYRHRGFEVYDQGVTTVSLRREVRL